MTFSTVVVSAVLVSNCSIIIIRNIAFIIIILKLNKNYNVSLTLYFAKRNASISDMYYANLIIACQQ